MSAGCFDYNRKKDGSPVCSLFLSPQPWSAFDKAPALVFVFLGWKTFGLLYVLQQTVNMLNA